MHIKITKIFLKDQFIMQLNKNDYCGFAKLCSNFDNSQKILLSNFMDYKIYKIKISFFRLKIKNNQKKII